LTSLAIVLSLLSGCQGAQELDYLGWFGATVQPKTQPLPGYYYDPKTPIPWQALRTTVPVRVKVFDGGSLCPNLTRHETYLYSPRPLPGYYMLPGAGRRLYPTLPMGWPYRPLSSLGPQAWNQW